MLEIKGLTVNFGNSDSVLKEFFLYIKKGDKVAVIGETGSGKSMLLTAILRLLPNDARLSGEILFKGKNLTLMDKKELYLIRGNQIAYIPQGSGNSLNPLIKVGKQIEEAMGKGKSGGKKSKALELLRSFNLGNEEKILKAYPHQLSGGMKQRVLIAMGVASGANLVLADEPTKGLDSKRIEIVKDYFLRLVDKTLLVVTHDINFAKDISQKIVVMYAAEQVEIANKTDFFNEQLHPYSKAMIHALPENGTNVLAGFAPPNSEYVNYGCRFYERCICKDYRCKKRPPMVKIKDREVRCWLYVD